MRVHDACIVRYDAEKEEPEEKSLSLPEHCDTSAVSVVLALNSEQDGEYAGGGTWFEALAEKGEWRGGWLAGWLTERVAQALTASLVFLLCCLLNGATTPWPDAT